MISYTHPSLETFHHHLSLSSDTKVKQEKTKYKPAKMCTWQLVLPPVRQRTRGCPHASTASPSWGLRATLATDYASWDSTPCQLSCTLCGFGSGSQKLQRVIAIRCGTFPAWSLRSRSRFDRTVSLRLHVERATSVGSNLPEGNRTAVLFKTIQMLSACATEYKLSTGVV